MTTAPTTSAAPSATASSSGPAIIIGAGRSGTNMLRDLLVSLPDFSTWPCDEINYIWRYGNRGFETDEFTREMANQDSVKYIRGQFEAQRKKQPTKTLVEKTCASSLRCGFIHEIFPNAKFVHIIRDGRDVAASAALRWNASLDIGYLLKKARFVPKSDLFYYASSYFKARIHKLTSGKSRLSTWGPKFEGMQEAFTENNLPVACAIQWQRCVSAAEKQLSELPSDQVLTIRYEAFTKNPAEEFEKVCQFLGSQPPRETIDELVKAVSNRSVGKWEKQLDEQDVSEIRRLVGDQLDRLGYGEQA